MLLINPAAEKFGGFLSRYVPVGIPVGIGCIAAYLEKHGIRCAVVDEEIADLTPSLLREKVADLEKPYIFGISCLTAHVARGYQLAAMIKAEYPDSTIVAGGLHPTSLPEEALGTGSIDYVVRGEGEEVMLQLYRALRGDGEPTKLRGVSFLRNGKVVNNPEASLIPDLNDIPIFPYHLFAHPKYDMGFMTTSRGCPYRCSYCSQRLLTGTTYRYKSADTIVQELNILHDQYGQKAVVFYDDNFCLKARRVLEVCDKIIEAGLHKKVKLSVQTRADNLLYNGGEEVIRRMAEAGFAHVGFGLETGVQRIADLMHKDETVDCHIEVTRLCRRYGIDVSLFMIFGFPTETAEDRRISYELVTRENVLASKFNNIIPYPSTPLYHALKSSGRVNITPNWANFNSTLSITRSIFDKTPLPYVPETASEFELKREIIKYNFRSYLTWRALGGIFGGNKGAGWYKLPERWFLQPREMFEMSKIAFHIFINLIIAYSPLWLTEPVMNALNPAMKTRPRVTAPIEDVNAIDQEDWDPKLAKSKAVMLKAARDERRVKGLVALTVDSASSPNA